MSELARLEPNIAFSFAVQIEGLVVGWFSECSNLSIERKVIPQPEGGVNDFVPQLPGPITWANLTLKRGLAGPELWDWFEQGRYDGQVKRRPVTIILYKGDRTEAQRWHLNDALPIKWSVSDLKTDDNQVFLETLELACGSDSQVVLQRQSETAIQAKHSSGSNSAPEIDLSDLAEAVYDLLKQELRVEQDRLGRPRLW